MWIIITTLFKLKLSYKLRFPQMHLRATVRFCQRAVAGAFVKGQVSSWDIVLLTKCHKIPGVDVTDRRPYLVG